MAALDFCTSDLDDETLHLEETPCADTANFHWRGIGGRGKMSGGRIPHGGRDNKLREFDEVAVHGWKGRVGYYPSNGGRRAGEGELVTEVFGPIV